MAQRTALEAFIKLFVDDATLKQRFGTLRAQAEKVGADATPVVDTAWRAA
jgi:hypothetical protein